MGRMGWLTTCIPQPIISASSREGGSRGSAGKPKDLDHTSMDHNLRYHFTLMWVLVLKRATLRKSHPGRGDAETERKLKDSPSVNSTFTHISFSFISSVTISYEDH